MPSARKAVPEFRSEAEERPFGKSTIVLTIWTGRGQRPSCLRTSGRLLPRSRYGFRLSFLLT